MSESTAYQSLTQSVVDMSESDVTEAIINGWLELPLGELVVAVARYWLKGFYKHADASENILWARARTEAEGS